MKVEFMTEKEIAFAIRRLAEDERQAALDLAWVVFSEYESPDYSAEGTEEFRKCLHDEGYLSGLHYYGAFDGEKLIGEIAIRPDKKHICFFFVDGRYHRRGIGTRMFEELIRIAEANKNITQMELDFIEGNTRARALYEKMGFRITGVKPNGIRLKDGTMLNEYMMVREVKR